MNLDEPPLGSLEVDCDGSACGSGGVGRHIHPPQGGAAIGRVRVIDGRRVGHGPAEGIRRLVMCGDPA